MATITNVLSGKLIKGTSSRDSITNGSYRNKSGYSSTIMSGEGNDIIENWGSNVSINCGAGSDYVHIPSEVWRITGMSIEFANNVSIEGGAGRDSLESYGAGTVYIYNDGDGNDFIKGFDEDDTLLIASGTWSKKKSGGDVIVTVGTGKITLKGAATLSSVNIVSSAEDIHPVNFIYNNRANTLVTGTSYKDSIYNDKVSSVTINAGADNDTIENRGGSFVSINAGAGNDVIENRLPTWASGRVDTNFLSCKNVTLSGGAGNDYIYNDVRNVTIAGGKGNDYIYNSSGSTGDVGGLGASVSVNGGDGNDYIENRGGRVTITGGAGNDSIENNEDKVTIAGGKGNDLISLYSSSYGYSGVKNNVILYNAGDGNDSIIGFNEDSTLSISSGTYSTTASGNDIIVTVGDGKITLKNLLITSNVLHINNKNITLEKSIKLTDGNDSIEITKDYLTVDGSKGNDSIVNDANNVSINGNAGNDSIINGEYFNGAVGKNSTINGGAGNDTIDNYGNNVKIYGGAGNDDIFNEGRYEEISENVTVKAGKGDDSIVLSEKSKKNLIEYSAGDGNDTIEVFNSTSTLSISGSTYSTTTSGNDIIVTVGKEKITLKNILVNTSKFHINDKSISLKKNIKLTDGNDSVTNYRNSVTINAGKGNDELNNFGNKVSIYGGAGKDSIWNNGDNVSINAGAGDDSIYNTGYYNGSDVGGSLTAIDGGDGNDYINNYYADNSTIKGGKGNDSIYNEGDNISIDGNAGNDYIFNGGDSVSIDAGAGDDSIMIGWINDAVSINGGEGNDFISVSSSWYTRDTTIKGGKGNDTIYGNSDVDYYHGSTYEYSSGDGFDKIYGFTAYDTLQISGSTSTYSTVASGKNIIVTVGEGKITLVGAKNLGTKLNIIGIDGKILTVTNSTKSPVSVDFLYGFIDASKRTTAVKITGNELNNTIEGGSGKDSINGGAGNDSLLGKAGNDKLYGEAGNDILKGGKGNDTLTGGKGNDSLWGNDGADTFLYSSGDGKDIIYGFDNNDMLKITGTFTTTVKDSAIYFKVGSTESAITLKDFSATTFNLSGTNYKINGSKLVEK